MLSMRINQTEIKIIQGEIFEVRADALVNLADGELVMSEDRPAVGEREKKFCAFNENQVRSNCRRVLEEASDKKISSIVLPALGCGTGAFSAVASAKIMAQEVLRHIRETETSLKEIIFCLSSSAETQAFEKNALGYLDYIVNKLKTPFLTVDAIIETEGGIVLIKRSNPPFGWALPGGFVDYGESLEEAVIREAKEETALDIIDIRQFHTYSDPGRDPRFHTVTTVFVARSSGKLQAGDDAAAAQVVAEPELDKFDFAFDHRKVLQEYFSSRRQ
jgi:8-oxo-dGTP diphosphatase